MQTAQRWIVREDPIPTLSADACVAARRKVERVAIGSVTPKLNQFRDVRTRHQTAHSACGITLGRMRSRVTEAPKKENLGSDEYQVTVPELVRFG